jgi:hypothetical protein
MPFIGWFRVIRVLFCVAEKADAEGDKRSGDTTKLDVLTHSEPFSNTSLRYACFISQSPGTALLKCWIIRITKLQDVRLKNFAVFYSVLSAQVPPNFQAEK